MPYDCILQFNDKDYYQHRQSAHPPRLPISKTGSSCLSTHQPIALTIPQASISSDLLPSKEGVSILHVGCILSCNILWIYKYQLITGMEEEEAQWPVAGLLSSLINSSHLNLMQALISFLSPPQIAAIATPLTDRPQFFFKMATAQHFLNQYVNRLDRTNYYLFYDEAQFKRIEQQHLLHLVHAHYPTLAQHCLAFQALQTELSMTLEGLEGKEEVTGIMEAIFFQTDLSLPKMKRETIGMFCESGLQEWLALLHFPQEEIEEPWIEQGIAQLQSHIDNDYQLLISHFPYHSHPNTNTHHPASTTHEKIRLLRFCGYKVDHSNWRDFLIEGFRLHNLLVVVFALCSQLVCSFSFILAQIEDPFMRFTEFTLRANVYRNLILNLDQKFAFLFKTYSQFYQNVYSPPPDRPPFRFWQPAMSIWVQQMRIFHSFNEKVFDYVGAKMRQTSLLQFLQEKTDKLPSFYSALKEKIQLHAFSESLHDQVYTENGNRVELECFFQENAELYEVISKDYLQYMVDISVDQVTVHKCGHSKHLIGSHPLFRQFSGSTINHTLQFYTLIKQVLFQSSPPQLRLGFYRQVVREDLSFLGLKLGKPVMLSQLLGLVNEGIQQQIQKMAEWAVFGEQGIAKYRINLQFQEKDALLDYFCGKYNIREYPQRLQLYYQVQVEDASQAVSDCEEDSFEYCQAYISEGQGEADD